MASFLRNLPAEARSLIDEMSQHWHDLERLKATGGTPTALIMKGLRVGRAEDGATAFVVRKPRGLRPQRCVQPEESLLDV